MAKSNTDNRGSFRDKPQFLTIWEISKVLDKLKQVEEILEEKKTTRQEVPKDANKMPEDSVFFDKLVPVLLITLGVIMMLLIIIAAGVLLGLF